jgi:CcmD family protein
MEPLLLAGYTTLFLVLFAYLFRLQRRLAAVERSLDDIRG